MIERKRARRSSGCCARDRAGDRGVDSGGFGIESRNARDVAGTVASDFAVNTRVHGGRAVQKRRRVAAHRQKRTFLDVFRVAGKR